MRRPNHVVLSTAAVMDILALRAAQPTYARAMRRQHSHGLSTQLAQKYGVSRRAIRNVWNRRTFATFAIHDPATDDSGDDLHWLLCE